MPQQPPLDPYERAARRTDPEYAQLAEAADAVPPRGLRPARLLLGFAVLVAVAALVKSGNGTASSRGSCTTPALTIQPDTAREGDVISWRATGSAELRAVLALDARVVPTTPLAGPKPLTGCLARGLFTLHAAKGNHTVTLFLLRPDGAVTKRLSQPLEVD